MPRRRPTGSSRTPSGNALATRSCARATRSAFLSAHVCSRWIVVAHGSWRWTLLRWACCSDATAAAARTAARRLRVAGHAGPRVELLPRRAARGRPRPPTPRRRGPSSPVARATRRRGGGAHPPRAVASSTRLADHEQPDALLRWWVRKEARAQGDRPRSRRSTRRASRSAAPGEPPRLLGWDGPGPRPCAELADLDLDGAVAAVAVQTRDSLRVQVDQCSLSSPGVVSGGSGRSRRASGGRAPRASAPAALLGQLHEVRGRHGAVLVLPRPAPQERRRTTRHRARGAGHAA